MQKVCDRRAVPDTASVVVRWYMHFDAIFPQITKAPPFLLVRQNSHRASGDATGNGSWNNAGIINGAPTGTGDSATGNGSGAAIKSAGNENTGAVTVWQGVRLRSLCW